jgi:hypothetical protein
MVDQQPFADVIATEEGFSIPELKWRELVFIGALRADGEHFVRDPRRPMPPFQQSGLFPDDARFAIRRGFGRVHLKRL